MMSDDKAPAECDDEQKRYRIYLACRGCRHALTAGGRFCPRCAKKARLRGAEEAEA